MFNLNIKSANSNFHDNKYILLCKREINCQSRHNSILQYANKHHGNQI